MKKIIFWLLLSLSIVGSIYAQGDSDPSIFLSFVPLIIYVLLIIIQIKAGKAIGRKLKKDTGILVGILFIILAVTCVMGIVILVTIFKKKEVVSSPAVDVHEGGAGQKIKSYEKFVGKNYKDVLLENGLGEYIDIFTENKLTEIPIIAELSDSELEKIGITTLGDRKKILKIFSPD